MSFPLRSDETTDGMGTLQLAATQLATASTPVVITRAVVTAMTNAVCVTVSRLYATVDGAKDAEASRELDDLFIRTDVELIAALLADMSADVDASISVRVCLDHLHHSLQDLNGSLSALDASVSRAWYYPRRWQASASPQLLVDVTMKKRRLDHHFRRLVQIVQVHDATAASRSSDRCD